MKEGAFYLTKLFEINSWEVKFKLFTTNYGEFYGHFEIKCNCKRVRNKVPEQFCILFETGKTLDSTKLPIFI